MQHSEDLTDRILTPLLTTLLLASPILALLFFRCYLPRLDEANFKGRFGSIYLNLKPDSFACLLHTVLYLLRRLLYALSIVYLGPAAQYHLFVASSALLLTYQLRVMPMDDPQSQRMEIFNEATIFLVGSLSGPFFSSQAEGEAR